MKHRIGYNRLGRNVSHRKALYRSMTTALFRHERIKTTKPKAREIRKVAERLITRARIDTVHNRRIAAKTIQDKEILAKLFNDIGPRFKERPGASEMVFLELVEHKELARKKRKKPAEKQESQES